MPRLALRVSVAVSAMLMLTWHYGADMVAWVLPTTTRLIQWWDPSWSVISLELERGVQESVVRLRVTLAQAMFLNGHIIFPQPGAWIDSFTPLGTQLLPIVIAPCAAWVSSATGWQAAIAAIIVAGITLLLLPIDIALSLLAFAWDVFHAHYASGQFSLLLGWNDFMRTGGRVALAISLGVLIAGLLSRFNRVHLHSPDAEHSPQAMA